MQVEFRYDRGEVFECQNRLSFGRRWMTGMGDTVKMIGWCLLAYAAIKALLALYAEYDLHRSFTVRAKRETKAKGRA